MQQALDIIYYILLYPTLFLACYYGILGIIGLITHRQKYPLLEDKLKFCIFVPCHNEANIIASTIANLAKINYDSRLFDIYFIADNCSDSTAQEIRKAIEENNVSNMYCLERSVEDPTKKGKPHAMRWGIEYLEAKENFYNTYDMFMILDADNFVDAEILKHINSQYLSYKENKRPVMIQAYLDSKNKNNIISRGYYVTYRLTNGFFQLPRHKLGLTPGIGGTGFAVSTNFLKDIGGYNCTSLVEDLEFQTIATLKGKSIAYNHNARVYDEKPTGVRQSAIQKTRWAQGHWFVFFKYSWRMILKMLNPKEIKYFFKRLDNLIYLSSMLFMTFSMLITIMPIFFQICNASMPHNAILSAISSGLFVFSLLLFPISSLYDGKTKEKKMCLIELLPNIVSIFINSLIYYYANIVGLFKCRNQKVWAKTNHKVTSMETPQIKQETTTKISNNKKKKKLLRKTI